jgi:hypothetical protein
MITATTYTPFSGLFFSLNLHQQFNRKGHETGFESDESEPAVRKYARIITHLYKGEQP